MAGNLLYYGDNLDVLRQHVADESVDLVYLDPPFKSDQDYNVLFAERDGAQAAAQIKVFEDTWHWDQVAALAYQETVEQGGAVAQALIAFRTFLGENDMLAYLSMMAPRLVELRRVMKPTASIYLHCDPTASHYLKILMDAVFAPVHFRNELIWKRTQAHGSSRRFGPVHDTLLFYGKSENYLWTDPRLPHSQTYVSEKFTAVDDATGRNFQPITLTGSGVRHGESGQPWRGFDPTKQSRHWALPGDLVRETGIEGGTVQEKLDALDAADLIYWPEKKGGQPRLKWFADKLKGTAIPDVWTDIDPINSQARERLGYPTQKPEALLDRIIEASSNPGDLVLDPFCGCGTATASAQRLNRRWIGIDITHLAINLIRFRLQAAFGEAIKETYTVVGEPVSVPDAEALATEDPFQFQYWALGLVGARPGGAPKKGADRGIDGRLYFHDDVRAPTQQIILSVKAGGTNVAHLRDLRGVVERENAALGVLITMQEPTRPMRTEAASAGYWQSQWTGGKHPRLQLLTVAELLDGKRIDCPPLGQTSRTFKAAPKDQTPIGQQLELGAAPRPKTPPVKRSRGSKPDT